MKQIVFEVVSHVIVEYPDDYTEEEVTEIVHEDITSYLTLPDHPRNIKVADVELHDFRTL